MSDTAYIAEVNRPRELPFLVRAIWFFILGWELAGLWILIAWALNATILGLPLGLWMIDRVPQVLTLKARPGGWAFDKQAGSFRYQPERQLPILLRAAYFVLFGWWVSLLWATVAWILCATIIGLPIGILMLHALPAVTTLYRA